MSRRTFSPKEVQALIPSLEVIFGELSLLQAELGRAEAELEAARARGSDRPVSELRAETEALGQRSAELRAKLDRARNLLARVQEMGGEVKDLQRGLVDFPWSRQGKVVLLCWQFGEKRVTHWHTEEEGFSGRKPLEGVQPVPRELLN